MTWQFLVDEDTDTEVADELTARGFDAVTVAATLGKGKPDHAVGEYARKENRVLVTTDRDFLNPERYSEVRVLLVADDDAIGHEIAEKAAQLARLADDPSDLKRVTWI